MRPSRWAAPLVLMLLFTAGCATPSPLVGKAAPDFRLRDQDDQPIQLSDYHGKQSLVLVFYYSSN
jgi:cytochrome oxidase Cu insertion factor (SCO1/SenC/PrrC family)